MEIPTTIQQIGEIAVFRPTGTVSLEEGIRMLIDAIALAKESGIRKLVLNTLGLTGFQPPNTLERYYLGERMAHAAGGRVTVATVARADLIDPAKFGVTVARNRGLTTDVFTSEDEAILWLERQT